MEAIIREAIEKRRVLEFTCRMRYHLAEPHVLGIKGNRKQLLAYLVGGSGRGGQLPRWQRFDVSEMREVRMSDAEFEGPRSETSGRHTDFDRIVAMVQEG